MERVWPKLGDVLLIVLAVVVGAAAVAVSLGYGLRDAPGTADAGGPATSPSRTSVERQVRALFIGGSVVAGASRTPGTPTLSEVAAVQLGWEAEYDGRIGAGWTVPGRSSAPDLTELTERDTDAPLADVVIVQGGEADVAASPADVSAGVAEMIGAIRTAFPPTTRIVVVGPFSPLPNAPAPLIGVRDAVRDAAKALKVHYFDPIDEGWISASQPAGLVNPGSRLPTSDGHLALGRILAADLEKLQVQPLT